MDRGVSKLQIFCGRLKSMVPDVAVLICRVGVVNEVLHVECWVRGDVVKLLGVVPHHRDHGFGLLPVGVLWKDFGEEW